MLSFGIQDNKFVTCSYFSIDQLLSIACIVFWYIKSFIDAQEDADL